MSRFFLFFSLLAWVEQKLAEVELVVFWWIKLVEGLFEA